MRGIAFAFSQHNGRREGRDTRVDVHDCSARKIKRAAVADKTADSPKPNGKRGC